MSLDEQTSSSSKQKTKSRSLYCVVQEDAQRGIMLPAPVIKQPLSDMHTIVDALRDALDKRSVAATGMNEQSSRAHTIFQVQIDAFARGVATGGGASGRRGSKGGGGSGAAVRHSTLTFVDLAGSERLSKSQTSGAHACDSPCPLCQLLPLFPVPDANTMQCCCKLGMSRREHSASRRLMLTSVVTV